MIVTWDRGHFTAVSIRTSKVKPGAFKTQFSQKNRSWINERVMEGVREEFRLAQNSNKPQETGKRESGATWRAGNHCHSKVKRKTLIIPGFYAPGGQGLWFLIYSVSSEASTIGTHCMTMRLYWINQSIWSVVHSWITNVLLEIYIEWIQFNKQSTYYVLGTMLDTRKNISYGSCPQGICSVVFETDTSLCGSCSTKIWRC